MNVRSALQKISAVTVLSLILALVPLSTVSAAWNGQFTLSSATYSAGEWGGTVSITIRLSGFGTGKTNISYATSNGTATAGSDYTSTSGTRRFRRAGSWIFTIPITNDSIVEGNEIFNVTLSNPTNGTTLGTPSTAVVTIIDDDTAGITVIPTSGLSVTEAGGTATFTVVLNKQPGANVSLALSSSDTTEGTVSPASLTFTPIDWTTPQIVTVTGVDDFVDDGDIAFNIITAAASSDDPAYDGMNASDVAFINIDNDTAGITVTPTSGLSVTEAGGTATFTVVLTSQPGANVSIDLSSSDLTEGTVSPASLTFTTTDWTTPQIVTVTGVDDGNFVDGNIDFDIVTAAASSTDLKYNGMNASDVLVTNIDADAPGITVIPTSSWSVTEAGGTATFTVVLNTQPVANVSLALSSSDLTEGTVSPASLTFTPIDWTTPQIVTVTGVDDFVDDGDIAFNIITAAASSDDPAYDGMNASDVAFINIDNDTAGITVTPTSGLSVTEAGGTATFTVVLTSQPGANVSIDLSSSDTTEGTVSPAILTFTTANWNSAQTVTVTGVDDIVVDGNIDFDIVTAAASSTDLKYNGMNAADVLITNIDDDAPANIPPTAVPDTYSTLWRNSLIVNAATGVLSNDSDADDDTLEAVLVADVFHGTLSLASDGSFTYTPASGYVTSDSFTYHAYDGEDYSNTVTVTINYTNTDPTATLDSYNMHWSGSLDVNTAAGVLSNDSDLDDDSLTAVLVDDVSHGTLSLAADGSFTYTPDSGYVASDSFTYRAYDSVDYSNIVTVTINYTNTDPTGIDDDYATPWRNSLSITEFDGVLMNDHDDDSDPLTAELYDGPAVEQGTLTFNSNGSFMFTPTDSFSGDASFTYRVYDGPAYSSPVTVTIRVVVRRLFLPLVIKLGS